MNAAPLCVLDKEAQQYYYLYQIKSNSSICYRKA